MSRAGLALICFMSGIVIDQLFSRAFFSAQQKEVAQTSPSSAETQVVPVISPHPQTVLASRSPYPLAAAIARNQTVATPVPAPVTSVVPVPFDPAAELANTSDFESRIDALIQSSLPAIGEVARETNPDGSEDVFGKSEDGKDVFQHYNPQGRLMQDGWSNPAGESMQRAYYENGAMKQFNWSDSTAMSVVSYHESGYPESRVIKTPDGKLISTNYDDRGQVRDVWAIDQSGKAERISGSGPPPSLPENDEDTQSPTQIETDTPE